MHFKIRRDLPYPDPRARNKYPIKALKVGDGFVIPKGRVPKGPINGLGARYGMRISMKKQPDGSVHVVRIA